MQKMLAKKEPSQALIWLGMAVVLALLPLAMRANYTLHLAVAIGITPS